MRKGLGINWVQFAEFYTFSTAWAIKVVRYVNFIHRLYPAQITFSQTNAQRFSSPASLFTPTLSSVSTRPTTNSK